MPDPISLEGPVEELSGQLVIRIPLHSGGAELAPLARGIGAIDGDFLQVVIKPWMAETLRIGPGALAKVSSVITRQPCILATSTTLLAFR